VSNQVLPFTAVQPGLARQIDFPLHPQTVSAQQVGALLEALLDAISREIKAQGRVSDGDVLQSLCMTLAIRMHMVDAPIGAVQQLVASLLDQADDAVADSTGHPAGKA
jgi:hypothetical protein